MKYYHRFILALLSYCYPKTATNQGFVLPLIVGFGLIMTIAGLTMIGRSSNDQQTAIVKQQNAETLAVTETGISRVTQFLHSVPILIDQDLANWRTTFNEKAAACASTAKLDKYVDGEWIKINNDQAQFRVNRYDYNPNAEEATLEVEGQSNLNGNNPSTSVVQVIIPIVDSNIDVPGLFVKQAGLMNNQVNGDLLLKDCELTNVDTTNITGASKADPFAEFPDLPQPPTSITAPHDLGTITSTVTLPDDHEVASAKDGEGRYHYVVDSIDLGGSQSITITPGEQVTLYLQGDADFRGSAGLQHDCSATGCDPTNFQVFGGDGSTGGVYAGNETSLFCLSGNSTADIFLFAPAAKAAVNGSGSGDGFTGTVWIDRWNQGNPNSCGSNAGQVVVTQQANWTNLPLEPPQRITPPSTWRRQSK